MEAEYQSASLWGREVMWPQLGFTVDVPTQIYGDNKAWLAPCASQQTTTMSQHIHIIHCWVFEKVDDGALELSHIASAENESIQLHKKTLQAGI